MKEDGVVLVEIYPSQSVMKGGYVVVRHSVKQGEQL